VRPDIARVTLGREEEQSMDSLERRLEELESRLTALESQRTVRAPFRVVDAAGSLLLAVELDEQNGRGPTTKLTVYEPKYGRAAISLEAAPGEEAVSVTIREGTPGEADERGISLVSDGLIATWKGDQYRVVLGELGIEVYPEVGDRPVATLYAGHEGGLLTLRDPAGEVRLQVP
jgi:hypothetical protein